jgi:hypothetical protein
MLAENKKRLEARGLGAGSAATAAVWGMAAAAALSGLLGMHR